ncbi:hypothetical protein OGZ02_15745 [Brachyspira hyodysenteriae]|nr:hypothetical protein [Brachyspira hyodysenteriae]MDA1470230.1 hypothetical protein [Brachyspira hyodysenteriae]
MQQMISSGDYACPAAMRLAKVLKKSLEIAASITEKIDKKYFEKIEAVKPGFINLTLSYNYINECINDLLNNDNYGKNTVEDKKKILIEYVSANPTGPLHIGHGRWAAIEVLYQIYLNMQDMKFIRSFMLMMQESR